MTNDSSTGGYLVPSPSPAPTPIQDLDLDKFFQALIVNLTGLPGSLVFPRFQVVENNMPPVSTNWAAVSVTADAGDTFAYEAHNPVIPVVPQPPFNPPAPPAEGFQMMIRNEILDVLVSFYGPGARGNAALVRDGLSIAQNREALQLNRMGLVECEVIRALPSLVNNQWYYRADMPIRMRREVVRYYPILDIASVPITIKDDVGISININP